MQTKKAASAGSFNENQKIDFLLNEFYVHRVQPFLALGDLERHVVFLANLVDQTGYVNKNIFTATYRGDKSETFSLIEEFYYAFLHGNYGIKINNGVNVCII